jgi:site-specific DNA recombinase
MKSAAIYARVSTQSQARDGTSLDTQVSSCRDYAAQHGYTVVKAIAEDASGARLDRAGLSEIRDLAEAGQLQAVVVHDPDRLSRSLAHLMLLTEEFERRRVELLFVNSPREDTPEGNMLFGLKGLFAEYERSKITERTRRGKERRARDGKILGAGVSPYGYTYVPGEGKYILQEDEAAWVTKMFVWLVEERCSLYEIAKRLNDAGVVPKQGAKMWSPTCLRYILKNSAYTGQWHWNKTMSIVPLRPRAPFRKSEKTSRVQRDTSEWIAIPVPAVIPQELYDAAQRQLQRNREQSKRNCKNEYLFRGYLVCAKCGSRLRGHITRGWRYYECLGRDNRRAPHKTKCSTRPYNATTLEKLVWDEVLTLLSDPLRIRQAVERHSERLEHEQGKLDAELSSLYSVEQTIQKEEARLLDAYAAGVIELPQLQEKLAVTKKKREAITMEKNKIIENAERNTMVKTDVRALERLCQVVQRGLHLLTFDDKRMALELLDVKAHVDEAQVIVKGFITDTMLSPTDQIGKPISEYKTKPPSPKTEGPVVFRASPAGFTPGHLPRR